MKKLLISCLLAGGCFAMASAQTSAAKTPTGKPHPYLPAGGAEQPTTAAGIAYKNAAIAAAARNAALTAEKPRPTSAKNLNSKKIN